ncbi:MAG: lipopolysaccharide heptosyltransferase II [Candidatus Omnitrophota bacterium]
MEKRNFENILVVRTDRIGDVVLTTPALEALRKAYPRAKISIMVAPTTKDIVDGNPFLDEVIVYDKRGVDKGFLNFWRFVFKLRKKHFDLAINYHLKSRTNVMLFHAGIPHRIGFKSEKFGFLLTEQYPDPRINGEKHETEYCLDLLRHIGIDCRSFNLWVSVSPVSEGWVDHTFKEHGILPTDKLIAVHPGASCISKRWPPERFAEVADRLAEKYHAKIVLIGSDDNQLIAREVLISMKQPVADITGKTTVSHLISVLKRCTLLISNDSGPVHLAVGVKTPVISIFGRNQAGLSPARWRPLGFLDIALHKDVGCKVCLAHLCELNFKCLKSISVDHVLEAADEIFNKSKR